MKTTKRFDAAIQKLYTAFHNNTLDPDSCTHCAVGNILNNTESWKHLSDDHGSTRLNYVGRVHQTLGRTFGGYAPLEILQIEATFLKACGFTVPLHYSNKKPENPRDKNVLFKALSAVIAYLCALDGIENVMDCSQLLDYTIVEKSAETVAL